MCIQADASKGYDHGTLEFVQVQKADTQKDITVEMNIRERHQCICPLLQKCEKIRVYDIESAVGFALLDDAGDVNLTGTCNPKLAFASHTSTMQPVENT